MVGIMQWLRRSDANSTSNVRPGIPDHRAANSEKEATLTKQANKGVKNLAGSDGKSTVYTQTRALRHVSLHARIRFAIYNGNAQTVKAFPGITETTVR